MGQRAMNRGDLLTTARFGQALFADHAAKRAFVVFAEEAIAGGKFFFQLRVGRIRWRSVGCAGARWMIQRDGRYS